MGDITRGTIHSLRFCGHDRRGARLRSGGDGAAAQAEDRLHHHAERPAGEIMVGSNAGASPLAGSQCNELYFSTSWNNDQSPEAMGKYLQDKGINDLYVLAPNYQAGKDMVAGLKRYYKGRIVEEVYTKFQQQDYQAEISQLRSKSPKAVFAFYPGGMGIQFVKQYVQAGLREQIPLYTVFTVDETTLPALKEAAIGQYEARFWSPDIKIPASEKYVADFRKKFGYTPS